MADATIGIKVDVNATQAQKTLDVVAKAAEKAAAVAAAAAVKEAKAAEAAERAKQRLADQAERAAARQETAADRAAASAERQRVREAKAAKKAADDVVREQARIERAQFGSQAPNVTRTRAYWQAQTQAAVQGAQQAQAAFAAYQARVQPPAPVVAPQTSGFTRLQQAAVSAYARIQQTATTAYARLTQGAQQATTAYARLTQGAQQATTANARLSTSVGGVGTQASSSASRVRDLVSALFRVGGAVAGVGVIKQQFGELVQVAISSEQAFNRFKFAAGSSDGAAEYLEYARKEADRLGLPLKDVYETVSKITAVFKETDRGAGAGLQVFSGIAEYAKVIGASSEEVKGVTKAVTDMVSKGTVQLEELKGQLGDRLLGAISLGAKAAQLSIKDFLKAISDGRVDAVPFLEQFAYTLHEVSAKDLPNAVHSTESEIDRMGNAFFKLREDVLKAGVGDLIRDEIKKITEALASAEFRKGFAEFGELAGKTLVLLKDLGIRSQAVADKSRAEREAGFAATFLPANWAGKDGLKLEVAKAAIDAKMNEELAALYTDYADAKGRTKDSKEAARRAAEQKAASTPQVSSSTKVPPIPVAPGLVIPAVPPNLTNVNGTVPFYAPPPQIPSAPPGVAKLPTYGPNGPVFTPPPAFTLAPPKNDSEQQQAADALAKAAREKAKEANAAELRETEKSLEVSLAKRLITEREYLRAKSLAETEAAQKDIAAQQALVDELAKGAANPKLDQVQRDKERAKLIEAQADLDKLKAKPVEIKLEFDKGITDLNEKAREFKSNLQVEIASEDGTPLVDQLKQITEQYAKLKSEYGDDPDMQRLLGIREAQVARKATTDNADRKSGLVDQRLTLTEGKLESDYNQGLLTSIELNKGLTEARNAAADSLQKEADAMRAANTALEGAGGQISDESLLRLEELDQKIHQLRISSADFWTDFNKGAGSALTNSIQNANSFKDLWLGTLQGLVGYLRDYFAKAAGESFTKALQGARSGSGSAGASGGGGSFLSTAATWLGSFFDTGGYTGAGAKLEPAGIVHKGEVVFDQPAVKQIGLGNLLWMQQQRRILPGYSNGGAVGISAPAAMPKVGGGAGMKAGDTNVNAALYLDPDHAAEAVMNAKGTEARIVSIVMANSRRIGIR